MSFGVAVKGYRGSFALSGQGSAGKAGVGQLGVVPLLQHPGHCMEAKKAMIMRVLRQ